MARLPQSPHVSAHPKLPRIADKTLVAWVTVADLGQRGGSALTIENSDSFDAIVLGERKPRAWMAGSEMFRRTQQDQSASPEETAGTREPVRVAIAYEGSTVTLYRNDAVIGEYTMPKPPLEFASGARVLMGLRHMARMGQEDSYFAGTVDEARLYDRALTPQEVASLRRGADDGTRPLARWTFDDGTARDSQGVFPPGELRGGAVIRGGKLHLNGKDAAMITPAGRTWRSRTHYRPLVGNLADPIPFYWKGEYHVFYLQGDVGLVPWRHIVSRNLVDWKELPDALLSDGPKDGPDGGHMFTGCVIEHAGTFHIFYTGHNPNNPAALEVIRHATSPDLVRWTKKPEFTLGPDGVHYAAPRVRNWRDPFVFWNEEERRWWMLVIASDPTDAGRAVQGLLVSDDLVTWEQRPAIPGGRGEECPDLFRIGPTWYLIGAGRYVTGSAPGGPYSSPAHDVVDFPGIYAGKRMFDGTRHVWVGWAWDGPAQTDSGVAGEGVLSWGGFMCLPRELYAGPDGQLLCKPVDEMVALYSKTVLDAPPGATGPVDLPTDGMVECVIEPNGADEIVLAVREQADGSAYRFIVRPGEGRIALATPASEWSRGGCKWDATKPFTLRVYLDGSMMECFVNDAYAITRRVYDLDGGTLRFTSRGGSARVLSLRVNAPSRAIRITRTKAASPP